MKCYQIFEYIIEELRKLNTPIALRLELAVEDRVAERRLKEAATLLAYLKDPKFLDRLPQENKVLPYASKKEITTFARDLYIRLFHKEENPQAQRPNHLQGDPILEDQSEGEPPAKISRTQDSQEVEISRTQELDARLEKNKRKSGERQGTMSGAGSVSTLILNALKTDMKKFEGMGLGHRSTMLAQIYRALLSIPPTSCEAERNGIHTSFYHMEL